MHNRYLSLLFIIVLWLFSAKLNAQQNNGIITGKLTNGLGEPLSPVSIRVLKSAYGTVSDKNGSFKLKQIPEGTHHIEFSMVGYQNHIEVITLKSNQQLNMGEIVLQKANYEIPEVVITATRTERNVEDVPIPVTVISGEKVKNMGSMRLSDVLSEQTGLTIISDHGNGVQIQGFSSDYTMILINGQPLIGRTAGTMELDRITVNNIKQIEITKGPSSSLYGSEALAGVINIITDDPQEALTTTLSAKYRTYNTLDLSADVEMRKDKLGAYLHINNYRSDGYDLTPETISQTAPAFNSYTLSGNITYDLTEKAKLKLNARYFTENQQDRSTTTVNDISHTLSFKGNQNDWNLVPLLEYNFTPHSKLILTNYTTGYNTKSDYNYESNGASFSTGFFNQLFNKSEAQADWKINKTNVLTSGVGYIIETLKSDRYQGLNQFTTFYSFIQNEWTPFDKKLTVLAGARFDSHSEYSYQLSPKLATQYKLSKWLTLKGSVGTGFKAPDFRQLFLNFTNPTVGYSVFGSSIVRDGIQELENQGQIQSTLINASTINTIKAENSIAYNFGFDLKPFEKLTIRNNIFRNDIKDLIEASPIAIKTNGQQVFTYFNISRVYTQGLETNIRYKLTKGLELSAGYQYLEAFDKDVIDQLEQGKIFAINQETGKTVRVKFSEYGGLFNRSRHSGTAKLFYQNDSLKLNISIRAIYRGDFGFGDINNNAILDSESEYVKGYTTWHLAISKKLLKDHLTIQFGMDNIFEVTNAFTPSLPGRFMYAGASYKLSKQ